ncbi:hypothetical protein RO3G_00159 [Rhizopus delemar RA 99-880]|uniref:Uncharacterized protein n=1 Tax=Rhizopus delemar (strain RA 99-880 / ATCC MYA-4621 / FGSC 9543 / NRRL 43880) TaxID=246409 RepID=I1BGX5_RHIO9|nr:hypothetical protein RO3G_00159 [Rhizopus delemar RA 99-880]|eukprot:EIE75455.1 hypothetical protein RO3G_00159 [Rhizopus delemar RA 99-880]
MLRMYQSSADPAHSESVFTNRLINEHKVTLFPGEEPLSTMLKCLKDKNGNYVCLVDDVFRMSSIYGIELLLLEVSGPF